MKALSLWQPWASAMERGVKTIETRSWSTNYRGDLVICSSLKQSGIEVRSAFGDMAYEDCLALPYGCALCVVQLVICLEIAAFQEWPEIERELGDFTPGRYAWLTSNLRRLKRPVPLRGRQGLFNLDESTAEAIRAML